MLKVSSPWTQVLAALSALPLKTGVRLHEFWVRLSTLARFMSPCFKPSNRLINPHEKCITISLFEDYSCSKMTYFAMDMKPDQLILPKMPGGLPSVGFTYLNV